MTESSSAGFPHSDICGSPCICHSPQLFAACHVFLRLSVPGHPSCALLCLTLVLPIFHSDMFCSLISLYRSHRAFLVLVFQDTSLLLRLWLLSFLSSCSSISFDTFLFSPIFGFHGTLSLTAFGHIWLFRSPLEKHSPDMLTYILYM